MKTEIYIAIVMIFIMILVYSVWYFNRMPTQSYRDTFTDTEIGIRYVAVGDSYTIGVGVEEDERWPNILFDHLKEMGINVQLVANLAVSGYTVKDVIEQELEQVKKIRPDFVTILIGANDSFSQKDAKSYQQELQDLLDKIQPMLTNPKNIVLITIPDYSKSPIARRYQSNGELYLIEQYNEMIRKEATKRNLGVVDIFPISQEMLNDKDYVSDGLHPSAISYSKWESVIFPVVFNLLKK